MKRKIIFIVLILACSLLMCSCDLSSLGLPFGDLTIDDETTEADVEVGDESTVETTDEAKDETVGETTEATLETTVEITEETTEEETRETDDETTAVDTDETTVESIDETTAESETKAEVETEEITDQVTEVETETETEAKTESKTEAETVEESEFSKLAYGKTTISGDILYVYELLEDHILAKNPASEIKFDSSRNITIDEFSDAVDIFFSDHPECFWWPGGGSYSTNKGAIAVFYPEYLFETNDIPTKRAELDAIVDEVLKGVPDGSVFDKALYLHDKVAEMVIYKRGTHDQTSYGALAVGEAVCNGYSTAYQLLLMKLGIRAWTIHGYSKGVAHAWTVVWLDDDTCVYTDVTWDDQDTHGVILRNYFNMSLDEIDDDHTVDSVFVLPECDHDNEGYYEVIGAVVDDSDGVDKLVGLFGTEENGERIAKFYYKGSDFNAWFNNNSNDIFVALGAKSLSYSMLGNEVTVTATK